MTGRFQLGRAEWQALAYEGGQTMTRNPALWEFLERYHEFLGPVDVHREAMMAAARWMVAA